MEKTYYFAVCTKHNLKNENWDALKEEYARRKPYCGELLFYCQSLEKNSFWYGNHAIYTFLDENKENTVYTLPEGAIGEFRTEGINSDYKLVIEFTNSKGENLPLVFKRINPYSHNDLIPQDTSCDDKKVMLEYYYQWEGYDNGAFKEVVKLIQYFRGDLSYSIYCEHLEQRFRFSKMLIEAFLDKKRVDNHRQFKSFISTQIALLKENLNAIGCDGGKDSTMVILQEKIKKCNEIVNECDTALKELNKSLYY